MSDASDRRFSKELARLDLDGLVKLARNEMWAALFWDAETQTERRRNEQLRRAYRAIDAAYTRGQRKLF